jgi:exodeoxyribonuclease-3
MRVISWNVNGIRSAADKGLFDYLSSESPDLLCLQETKAQPEVLTKRFFEARDSAGRLYAARFSSARKKGYSGVAVYAREEPDEESLLGVDEFDDEGRFLALRYGSLWVVSAYFPNSQDLGARLDYKLRFCGAVRSWCDSRVAKGQGVLVSGDYNIAHKPIDLERPRDNETSPGYLPEERAWMDSFVGAQADGAYVDTFRAFSDAPKAYTWWSYRMRAREKNVGWRLDYHCVDRATFGRVRSSSISADVFGSDHCPVAIDIRQ